MQASLARPGPARIARSSASSPAAATSARGAALVQLQQAFDRSGRVRRLAGWGASLQSPTARAPVQRVVIDDTEFDDDEAWEDVEYLLEAGKIPREHLPWMKSRFEQLAQREEFDYFETIAERLVDDINRELDLQLELVDDEQTDEPAPQSSGWSWSGLAGGLMKGLVGYLAAFSAVQGLLPQASALPQQGLVGPSGPKGSQSTALVPFAQHWTSPLTFTPPMLAGPLVGELTEDVGDITEWDAPRLTAEPTTGEDTQDLEYLDLTELPRIVESPISRPTRSTEPVRPPSQSSTGQGATLEDWIRWQIFSSRRNFGELPQIPRDDMSLGEWLINGPSWLYLPYTKFSPTEIWTVMKHFGLSPALEQLSLPTLVKTAKSTMYGRVYDPMPRVDVPSNLVKSFGKKLILRTGYNSLKAYYNLYKDFQRVNQEARDFRSDLAPDPWIKNSYRHAYWMCRYAREWGPEFALDLGYAHEHAHLDLTIEGPFDSVIDKINNLRGARLAGSSDESCELLVNSAGGSGQLAWAKSYAEDPESGRHLPTEHNLQTPLVRLWEDYEELPELTWHDLEALQALGVTLPSNED